MTRRRFSSFAGGLVPPLAAPHRRPFTLTAGHAAVFGGRPSPPAHVRCVMLWIALLLPAVASAQSFERWYVLTLGGQRVGWSRTASTAGDQQIESEMQMHMQIRRGPIDMTIEQATTFVETPAGEPISATSRMRMGQMEQSARYTFTEEGITMLRTQAGREVKRALPKIPGDWLPPAAAERHVRERLAQGAEEIQLRTLDVSMSPTPVEATMRVVGETEVEVLGKVVPAIEWEATVSLLQGTVVREYVDLEGRPLKTRIPLAAGMEVEMIAADEAVARSPVDPPEMLLSTMIEPAGDLPAPRDSRQAVYTIRITGEGEPIDLPRTGYQRVVWGDARTAKVIVDLGDPVNPLDDVADDADRASTTVLAAEDPRIVELTEQALEAAGAAGADDAARAEALRRFVAGYIQEKDLSVGFATASEVARTAQGDCTEHGVLLAAMLRAAGIPSRTVTGLIYVDRFLGREGVFGYHLWTQAWLADSTGAHRWVDLDATLPADGPAYDAAHIALRTSDMSEANMVNDMAALLPVFGRLAIVVESVEHGEPAGADASR
jgi:transglutaminase-like putative cysteine protease